MYLILVVGYKRTKTLFSQKGKKWPQVLKSPQNLLFFRYSLTRMNFKTG